MTKHVVSILAIFRLIPTCRAIIGALLLTVLYIVCFTTIPVGAGAACSVGDTHGDFTGGVSGANPSSKESIERINKQ